MFEQSLLETAAKGTRRPWTVLVSFVFQGLLLGILIVLPLLSIDALPRFQTFRMIEPPPGRPETQPPVRQVTHVQAEHQSEFVDNRRLMAPTVIPDKISTFTDEAPLAPPSGSFMPLNGVQGGLGDPRLSAFVPHVEAPPPPTPAPARTEKTRPVVIGGDVQSSMAISRPNPVYPPIARQARIQGRVMLEALISRNGTIENLRVVNGHPLLVPAALDAVRQWRYRPTMLNGEPVEVQTTIEVNFTLSQ
jgi:protein TonB